MRRGLLLTVGLVLLALIAVWQAGSATPAQDAGQEKAPWHVGPVTRQSQARPGAAAAQATPTTPVHGAGKFLHVRVDFIPPAAARKLHEFRVTDRQGRTLSEIYGFYKDRNLLVFEGDWSSLRGLYLDGLGHREPLFPVAAPPVKPAEAAEKTPQRTPVVMEPSAGERVVSSPARSMRIAPDRTDVAHAPVGETTAVRPGPKETSVVGGPERVVVEYRTPQRVVVREGSDRVVIEQRTPGRVVVRDSSERVVVHDGQPPVVVHDPSERVVVHGPSDRVIHEGGSDVVGGPGGAARVVDRGAGNDKAGAGERSRGKGQGRGKGRDDSKGTDNAPGDSMGPEDGNVPADRQTAGKGAGASKGQDQTVGKGSGNRRADGKRAGNGNTQDDASADSQGQGPGDSKGHGKGSGDGQGDRKGPGNGSGDAMGQSQADAKGSAPADGKGPGDGKGDGKGPSPAPGDSNAQGQGDKKGQASGDGQGAGDGQGSGSGAGDAKGQSKGSGDGKGQDQMDGKGQAGNKSPGDANCPEDGKGQGKDGRRPSGQQDAGKPANEANGSGDGSGNGPGTGNATGPGNGSGAGNAMGSGNATGPGSAAGSGGGSGGGASAYGPGTIGPRQDVIGDRLVPDYRGPGGRRIGRDIPAPVVPPVGSPAYVQPGMNTSVQPNYVVPGQAGPGGSGGGGPGGPAARGPVPERVASLPSDPLKLPPPLVLYVSCGEEAGPGRVYQVDDNGRVLGLVNLPYTATGLALHGDHGLVACMPRDGGRLVEIDDTGKVTSILSKDPILVHPVDVGIGANSDTIVVADNFSHVLAATNTGGVKAKVYRNLGYDKWLQPDMSVAVTRDKHVVFGTNGRSGIYRFSGDDNAKTRGPILPKPGGVAADTATQKWAATQSPNLIYVFDGEEQVKKLRLPPNKGIYRNGLLSFGLAGSVVVAARPSDDLEGDVWLIEYQTQNDDVRSLFPWKYERMVDFVVGPRMPWDWHDPRKPKARPIY